MPVSTRSQIINQGENESNTEHGIRTRVDQDNYRSAIPLRNPHHGLKEKMKELTLLYEQQKRASIALKNSSLRQEDLEFTTRPSFEIHGGNSEREEKESKLDHVMRENTMPNSTIKRTYVLPQPPIEDAKENFVAGTDRILGFSCPRKASITVARKLSLGNVAPIELKENGKTQNVQESEKVEAILEKPRKIGSRIFVFVRLRPMAKKEKEAGSRCCVRIVNRRDVYLTEFANEKDYLRLNRLRGRHFTFDASFPDSATQQEVYATT